MGDRRPRSARATLREAHEEAIIIASGRRRPARHRAVARRLAPAADRGRRGRDGGRADLDQIQNVVVIFAENRSFDNLYGCFPGANGVANASAASMTQVDRDGTAAARNCRRSGAGSRPRA